MIGDYKVDIYHIFAHLFGHISLFVLDLDIDLALLLARENSTVCVTKPYQHIIVEPKMESTHVPKLVNHLLLLHLNDFLNENWYLVDELIQIHGWSPL